MEEPETRIADFLAAPAGRVFLRLAADSQLDPQAIARPATSLSFAAEALDQVSRWRADRDEIFAALAQPDARLDVIATELLSSALTHWWFQPVDRNQQLWVSRDGSYPNAMELQTPRNPPDRWERYAQKSIGGLYTSTILERTSSLLVTIAHGGSDLASAFMHQPLTCTHLTVEMNARVFEIDGPRAWHQLCTRYSARGDDGRLVPDWSIVARDWDAVHITLGGLITAEQVRIDSRAGWTQLDGWDCESTLWLRWCFLTAARLGDIEPGAVSV